MAFNGSNGSLKWHENEEQKITDKNIGQQIR
jgi:hypothetical protein